MFIFPELSKRKYSRNRVIQSYSFESDMGVTYLLDMCHVFFCVCKDFVHADFFTVCGHISK